MLKTIITLLGFLIAGVLLRPCWTSEPNDAFKDQLKAMAGTWKVVSIETDGFKVPNFVVTEMVMKRDEAGAIAIRRKDKVLYDAKVVKLDPSKKPGWLDAEYTEGEQKGKTALGIYELDGGTMRVCMAGPGKSRPTEFSAKEASGQSFAVYQREKAK